ncbi:hypothetical protein GCM10022631_39870 [Deinococcus rubellus]
MRDLGDVNQPGLAVVELDKRTEVGDAGDAAFSDRAGIKLHEECPPKEAYKHGTPSQRGEASWQAEHGLPE